MNEIKKIITDPGKMTTDLQVLKLINKKLTHKLLASNWCTAR